MKTTVQLKKQHRQHSHYQPFETCTVTPAHPGAAKIIVRDSTGRDYFSAPARPGVAASFTVRGSAGRQLIEVLDTRAVTVAKAFITLKPATRLECNRGPYAALAERIARLIEIYQETHWFHINDRIYRMLICWTRDHVHTLKAWKYYMADVQTGLDYWLDRQTSNGMFWDCIYPNDAYPGRSWLGEALGKGWSMYDGGGKYVVRRVPVLADTEFVITEGVWYAWKASGDDAWMARQLPRLEKALKYNNSDRIRWSRKFGLVKRSMCMDGWDFANPHFCKGDHRVVHKGDPQFLFHGDNSGLYASYWRIAEMYEHLGNHERAKELRAEGEAFRRRANRKLFFDKVYGHMIPETLEEKKLYALVGDERSRMSLSTGYTINRRMPTHEMAVKIIDEYQRRGREKKAESFAEWWTMDPPYTAAQWPNRGTGDSLVGDYMNGGICPIIAGEIAKAAFDHGREAYGADILERVWELSERDGRGLHQVYRRLPHPAPQPVHHFQYADLRGVVNRGLRHGATKGVTAWTGEGVNDMRNLPTGRQTFGVIGFDIIPPAENGGRSVLFIAAGGYQGLPSSATIPIANLKGRSLFFLHTCAHSAPAHSVVGAYDVFYADGAVERIHLRSNHELALWWGISDTKMQHGGMAVDRATTRVAWRGANGEWKNVGMHMFGWNNPRPDTPVTAIRVEALGRERNGILLAGISFSDAPVAFETRIHSHGLPDNWAQAAVYYAVAEGLAGIEDTSSAFQTVSVSPRWCATKADHAEVVLHYPASDGYCACRYALDRARRRITLDLTGSFTRAKLHCMLPKGVKAKRVMVDGKSIAFKNTRVEQSGYVDATLDALPRGPVVITF
ncbi:hypothetical protein GX586_16090 [bacterium]|nr:hypothetical protein [bacterium]